MAAAMGIGRFAYTPILPLMTAHAGLTAQAAGHLATANYAGYLAGAVAGSVSGRLARSVAAWRTSLTVLVVSLAAMPFMSGTLGWLTLRAIAGFTSALVFVIAVNSMLDHLGDDAPHLPGWGFGGVGAGIALSALLVLMIPDAADWRSAWWIAAAMAAALSAYAWTMGPATSRETAVSTPPRRRMDRHFVLLLVSYSLEGIGYIVAGTFLVAAIKQSSPGWLANGAWLFVGIAAAPSAALWAYLCTRWSHSVLMVAALCIQAIGIALPAMAGGAVAALVGALLFGATFIGVSTLALGAGRLLQFPGAVAMLTAGYSAGQIIGPVAAIPLLHNGFSSALIAAALVVVSSALVAALLKIPRDTDRPQAAIPARRQRRDRRIRV